MNDIKISDYIVVLSGDKKRFDVGINLYKNGKAKKIVFTGGKLPWDKMKFNEGESYKIIARKLAIDEEDIIVTDIVQNTFQEAEKISLILPKNASIILVTSAFHMSRAEYLFEKKGLIINPFPVDFYENKKNFTIIDIFPSSKFLFRTSGILREFQGRFYYYFYYFFK